MRTRPRRFALVTMSLLGLASPVSAERGPRGMGPAAKSPAAATAAPAAASAEPASSAAPSAEPPAGALPSGHPNVEAGAEGRGELSPDEVALDPTLPTGTIVAALVDASNRPLANTPLVLDIDRNTVAEGETHSEREARTDEQGRARFDGLKIGSGMSYRVRTQRGEATFLSPSLSLKEQGGANVLLHVYEPVSALSEAMLVFEAFVILEIKQDTVRVNHLVRAYNLGRTAFVPKGLGLTLPAGARAFSQEANGGAITMRERGGEVTFEGTFTPGQAELTYGYTLPLEGGPGLDLELPLPPRVLQAQVAINAGPGMTLEVAGFSKAQPNRRRDGQRVLQAVKQLDPQRSPTEFLANVENGKLAIAVRGLPSSGQGPLVASVLAAGVLGLGVVAATRKNRRANRAELAAELGEARDALLGELAALERAKERGDLGPKSYERLRAALLDALARILVRLDEGNRSA